MTFVSVIPAMVHQNLDSVTNKTKPQGFQPYLNWYSYGGIWGAQFSKYLHYAHGMGLHDLPGGQYVLTLRPLLAAKNLLTPIY